MGKEELLIAASIIILVVLMMGRQPSFYKESEFKEQSKEIPAVEFSCSSDSECNWISTNCCQKNTDAAWRCANVYKPEVNCSEAFGCYGLRKSIPNQSCTCISNQCTAKSLPTNPCLFNREYESQYECACSGIWKGYTPFEFTCVDKTIKNIHYRFSQSFDS